MSNDCVTSYEKLQDHQFDKIIYYGISLLIFKLNLQTKFIDLVKIVYCSVGAKKTLLVTQPLTCY